MPSILRYTLALSMLAVLACCTACGPSQNEAMFERLAGTDFGGGIKLGLPAGEITPVLGVPTTIVTKSGGKVIEHYYLPSEETEARTDLPQLQLTYVEEKLSRIYTFDRPFDEGQPPAPKPVTVLPGLTLGSRKSDFTSKLGEPNFGAMKDQWRFTGQDGRSIAIQAYFTENPESKEPVCTKLSITLSPKLAEQRGEQYDK